MNESLWGSRGSLGSPTNWLASVREEGVRARILTAYVAGRLRQAGDGGAGGVLGRMARGDAVDLAAVYTQVEAAHIPDATKQELLLLFH